MIAFLILFILKTINKSKMSQLSLFVCGTINKIQAFGFSRVSRSQAPTWDCPSASKDMFTNMYLFMFMYMLLMISTEK